MATDLPPSTVADRVAAVRERIAAAARRHDRDPDEVRLVAVSKTHGPAACREVLAAGVADLGENRVQELVGKADAVGATVDGAPRWHLIGPLQSNKAGRVVNRGWWLQGLDRSSIVDRVARLSDDPSAQPVLVQVNVGDDPAKAGCAVSDAPALVDRAVRAGLDVRGLMTIPPLPPDGADAGEAARPHFAALRRLVQDLQREHPGLVELSMGMSADVEAAIAEGATIVRIGTAVFGRRGEHPWQPPDVPPSDGTTAW